MRRGLRRPVIFTMLMELVLRDLDDFVLAAICYAEDMFLAAALVAAEVMVARVIAKLKEVGMTVGAEKIHWTSHPKMVDASIVGWLCSVVEEVSEFVCLDGNARLAIAHRSAQANKCLAKWRTVSSSSWLPRKLLLNSVKSDIGESSKRQELESWSARMVANVIV